MVRRLAEANYFTFRDEATPERIRFWLRELRTPELLIEAAQSYRAEAELTGGERPSVRSAIEQNRAMVESDLAGEENRERELDRAYWAPLRAELERLRYVARRS